jgi:nitroimidazol reductase NimA-like FMN-containing flavoprotein (pyridoxamine 5'-phosphate oxidase superfamily)
MVNALKELTERECLELLAGRVLGRIAVVVQDAARVFPVNYLLEGRDVVFRTDEGTKLDAASRGALATFEVDDSDPLYHTGWSVMATGHLETVTESNDLHRMQALPVRLGVEPGGCSRTSASCR